MQAQVRGILKPDGSLELAEKPDLPAGPVEVVIRPAPTSARENFWDYLTRARAGLEATGSQFRTQAEIDEELQELRSGDERLDALFREMDQVGGQQARE